MFEVRKSGAEERERGRMGSHYRDIRNCVACVIKHRSVAQRACRETDVEPRRAVRLPELEGTMAIDFTPVVNESRLLRALWRSASSEYGCWMRSRWSGEEETEDIHEMGDQNMASLGGLHSVL